jgi:hypothetical protein
MDYEEINEDLLRAFPELSPAYQQLLDWWRGERPGQHILFEDVFARYIERLLAADSSAVRDAKLKAIFQFVEEMLANHGQVRNLALVGLLEARPLAWLQASKPYLGELAEAALDEFDPEWRSSSSKCPDRLSVETRDAYGVDAITNEVLRGAA